MKLRSKISRVAVLLLFASSTATAGDSGLILTMKVSGGVPDTGQAVFALLGSEADFLKNPLASRTIPIDASGNATARLDDLKPGTYALSVYYDQDSNGKLNTGLFGIPSEMVGFSNSAKGVFGPPSFSKAAFPLSGNREISIRLSNAKD